jgi:hypothetical protein
VTAVLDRPACLVERGPGHGQQGGPAVRLQQPRLLRRRPPGADHLLTGMKLDALAAQHLVQSGPLQVLLRPSAQQPGWQVVVHYRERRAVGEAQPLDEQHRGTGRQGQALGYLVRSRHLPYRQHRRRRPPVIRG